MTGSRAAAEVKAQVNVRPVRSQVFLVAVAIVAAIAVICSAGLIALGLEIGWFFLLFAAFVLVGGYRAWSKSQSDIDLQEAHPTHIALPDGTNLTTDSRILRSPDGLHGIVQLCSEILCRRPLPDPDGLVDSSAQIIPGSKNAALAIASQINSATQATTNALVDTLKLADASSDVAQQITDTSISGPEEAPSKNLNALISN